MSKTFHDNAGKGDVRRPAEVSSEQYSYNYDRIFGKKDAKPKLERCKVCHGEGGAFDCGYWYECPVCTAK